MAAAQKTNIRVEVVATRRTTAVVVAITVTVTGKLGIMIMDSNYVYNVI